MSHPGEWFPKPYADTVARLRVPAGFVLVAAFLYLASPDERSLAIGVPVAFAGLLLRGWAAGHLEKNRQLAVSGPYAHVRNPLYLGAIVALIGWTLLLRSVVLAIATGLMVIHFAFVARWEERELLSRFGEAYEAYRRVTPRFVPRPGGARRK